MICVSACETVSLTHKIHTTNQMNCAENATKKALLKLKNRRKNAEKPTILFPRNVKLIAY